MLHMHRMLYGFCQAIHTCWALTKNAGYRLCASEVAQMQAKNLHRPSAVACADLI